MIGFCRLYQPSGDSLLFLLMLVCLTMNDNFDYNRSCPFQVNHPPLASLKLATMLEKIDSLKVCSVVLIHRLSVIAILTLDCSLCYLQTKIPSYSSLVKAEENRGYIPCLY